MAIGLRFAAFVALSAALAGRALATETLVYTYDELGRLVSVTASGTINNNQKHSLCYDPAGNRTQYKSDSTGSSAACGVVANPAVLSIAAASATEGGALTFVVTRTGDASGAVSVNFSTASGTAISGSDFNAATGTVSFSAGQASATMTVTTIDDAQIESAENMTVTLSGPTGGATLATSSATGTINDNDGQAVVALTDNNLNVLPQHQGVYGCSIVAYIGWAGCWLTSNNIFVYNTGSSPQLDPGYSFGAGLTLQVNSAQYGTGVSP